MKRSATGIQKRPCVNALVLVLLAVSGCGRVDVVPTGERHDDAGPSCAATCDDRCVDTTTDPANCGACGHRCGAGEVCISGACTLACSGGTTPCGSRCVDLALDPKHCGACDKACDAGAVCTAGACRLECGSGTMNCDGRCVDLALDPTHCGACDTKCDAGLVCSKGACGLTCSGGATKCGDRCVDTAIDDTNCGGCDVKCPAKSSCVAGACTCESGLTMCGGACVDASNDIKNCGACGNVCASTGCQHGKCLVAQEIAIGYEHACAIVAPGKITPNEVRCWGKAGKDAVGPEGKGSVPSVVPFDLSAQDTPAKPTGKNVVFRSMQVGRDLSCVIEEVQDAKFPALASGALLCWGDSFILATSPATYGWTKWPAWLASSNSSTDGGRMHYSAGDQHYCWSIDDDYVRCRGLPDYGEVGVVDPDPYGGGWTLPPKIYPPGYRTVALKAGDYAYHTWSGTQLSFVGRRSCMLDNGNAWCWGASPADKLSFGAWTPTSVWTSSSSTPRAVSMASSATHSCLLAVDGEVYCWGAHYLGGTETSGGATDIGVKADAVAVDDATTYVLQSGKVSYWDATGTKTEVAGLADVVKLAAGYGSACVIKKDGSLWCWGSNLGGILGTGATGTSSSTPVEIIW